MPSYRFCRPDDLELIVRAINQCCRIHETDTPEMTEERLKAHMTLFAVRPGNCMVALERQQPVAAIISTRREAGAWIQTLGCQPAFQRRGVASQLVEALVRKIAIQRTEDITVDVPEDNDAALNFFQAVGFEERGRFVTLAGEPDNPGDLTWRSRPGTGGRAAECLRGVPRFSGMLGAQRGFPGRLWRIDTGLCLSGRRRDTGLPAASGRNDSGPRLCARCGRGPSQRRLADPPAHRGCVPSHDASQAERGRPVARRPAAAGPEAGAQLSPDGAEAVVRRCSNRPIPERKSES